METDGGGVGRLRDGCRWIDIENIAKKYGKVKVCLSLRRDHRGDGRAVRAA